MQGCILLCVSINYLCTVCPSKLLWIIMYTFSWQKQYILSQLTFLVKGLRMIHTLRHQKSTCGFKSAVLKALLNKWMSVLLSSGNTSSSSPRLIPPPSFSLTTDTASAGMYVAWRDTHIKMNSPIRHCFLRYRSTAVFVIESSPSLPWRCNVYTDCSRSSAPLLLISYCVVRVHLYCINTGANSYCNWESIPERTDLASAITMSLPWGKWINRLNRTHKQVMCFKASELSTLYLLVKHPRMITTNIQTIIIIILASTPKLMCCRFTFEMCEPFKFKWIMIGCQYVYCPCGYHAQNYNKYIKYEIISFICILSLWR